MIIFNITMQVLWSVHEEWKHWLVTTYLPSYLHAGTFTHYRITRLLEINEDDGPTYAVQLFSDDLKKVNDFKIQHLPSLLYAERTAWAENVYSFSTLMEVIN